MSARRALRLGVVAVVIAAGASAAQDSVPPGEQLVDPDAPEEAAAGASTGVVATVASDAPVDETPVHTPREPPQCTSTASRALLSELSRSSAMRREQLTELKLAAAELDRARAQLADERAQVDARIFELGEAERRLKEAQRAAAEAKDGKAREEAEAALSKVVAKMDPVAAAALLQQVEPGLAASLLTRMPASRAGAVLQSLPPSGAAELASRATGRGGAE